MSLNLVLAYESSALAAPASFRNGMQAAANILDSLIQDNITVTIQVGYGDWDNGADTGITTGAEGGDLNGLDVSYTSLRSALASHETSVVDQTFVNSLPNTSAVNGVSSLWVPSAVGKALGLMSATAPAIDGAVGIGTNIPTSLLVGVALHELTHAMGREPWAGTFDLFRYTSPGNHLFTASGTAVPAYFSIDGGTTKLADFGQTSDSSDFLNSGVQGPNDSFNEFYSSSTLQSLTTVDVTLLDALGFSTTPPVVSVIETDGSNSLTQVGRQYYLYNGGSGPSLKFGGGIVLAGEFGNAVPIAMEPTAGGYLVCWKSNDTGSYMVWNVDSSGNYVSSVFPSGGVSGYSAALESYETVFHHDLNGDGLIGPVTTVIETDGSNSLTQVGTNYFLYSSGVGPSLNFGGAPVVVGEFGNAVPIAMEPTAGGYLVCWRVLGADQYMVWNVDSSGNYVSSAFPSGGVSGSSAALESYETAFHHDLNGDGVTGLVTRVIETDGSNSLTQVGNNYHLTNSGVGPSLSFGGAPVVVGEFGNAAPIAMEPTAGGYLVCWKSSDTGQYMIWNVDSSGNYVSSALPSGGVSGTSAVLESYETVFHHDLNGDGVTGLAVGVAATLELSGAAAGTVTFAGSTGTLKLDAPSTFTGSIAGFAGNGTLSGSDHIDLATLAFNNLIQADSTYNTSTHLLSVSNGTTTDVLQFIGNYTAANFKFAADGNGGTIVYDPPATIDIADNRTITGSAELSGSQITVESGATLTLNNATAAGATIINNGTVSITNNSAVTIAAGTGQDNFVFAASFGQATIAGFKPATDTIQIDHAVFASMNALFAAIHDDTHGNAVITDAAHDTITIQHVTTAQLIAHQGDFHLV